MFSTRHGQPTRGGNSSVGRASAFQAEGRGFESRFPLQFMLLTSLAHVAQAVEHFLGKEEVTGSIPVVSSGTQRWPRCCLPCESVHGHRPCYDVGLCRTPEEIES